LIRTEASGSRIADVYIGRLNALDAGGVYLNVVIVAVSIDDTLILRDFDSHGNEGKGAEFFDKLNY
jgi:hypothetical protein